MIHIPQDWVEKARDGLNLFTHIEQLAAQRKKLMTALQIWAGAVVIGVAANLAGIWQQLAARVELFVRTTYPQAVVSIAPVNMSNQLIYICSWIAVPLVVRAILAGNSRNAKSWSWYFLRFLLASLWIGVAMGVAISFGTMAIAWGSSISFAASGGRFFASVVCPVLGVMALGLIGLYMLRVALTGLTFGSAYLLQGKGLLESYFKGSRLFNNHWPYVFGVLFYFFGFTALIQVWLAPLVPNDTPIAVIIGGLNYVLWPLYWGLMLPYHKRALRRR